jgi:hypothetical protein
MNRKVLMTLAALGAAAAISSPALASGGGGGGTGGGGGGGTAAGGGGTATAGGGGGGGGGTTTTLPAPPIPPATVSGLGPAPVYLHDSFGFNFTDTRYRADGRIVAINLADAVGGIRAEYPNNQAESWIGPAATSGALRWNWAVVGPPDDFEQYVQLQDNTEGFYSDGVMMVDGEPGAPETHPDILLPFAAPAASPSTVSFDEADQRAKTDIGFTNSSATNNNFATNGLVWLEIDGLSKVQPGGDGATQHWTLHTNGLSGATMSGSYLAAGQFGPTRDRIAVSYDPVNHIAEAAINGKLVASIPYTAPAIRYVGAEGTTDADVDNFSVTSGSATDPLPPAVAAPDTPNDQTKY